MGAVLIEVDMERCCGNGTCASFAPSLFALNERGELEVLRHEVLPEELDDAEEARLCCPVEAIRLVES